MEHEKLIDIRTFIQKDPFARMLGAEIECIEPGFSKVSLTVTDEMVNFHGITHGGLIFTLGDIAFAAASNSHGKTALAMNVNINFLKASKVGDRLVAEAREQHAGGRTALYAITVYEKNSGEVIARSQDLVYRTGKEFVFGETQQDYRAKGVALGAERIEHRR